MKTGSEYAKANPDCGDPNCPVCAWGTMEENCAYRASEASPPPCDASSPPKLEQARDAARYRWLKEQEVMWYPPGYNGNPNCYWQVEFLSGVSESLDAAIDAAMRLNKEPK